MPPGRAARVIAQHCKSLRDRRTGAASELRAHRLQRCCVFGRCQQVGLGNCSKSAQPILRKLLQGETFWRQYTEMVRILAQAARKRPYGLMLEVPRRNSVADS